MCIRTTDKYQLLPPMTPAEFKALKADIAERGVVIPIDTEVDSSRPAGIRNPAPFQTFIRPLWQRIARSGVRCLRGAPLPGMWNERRHVAVVR